MSGNHVCTLQFCVQWDAIRQRGFPETEHVLCKLSEECFTRCSTGCEQREPTAYELLQNLSKPHGNSPQLQILFRLSDLCYSRGNHRTLTAHELLGVVHHGRKEALQGLLQVVVQVVLEVDG